MPTYASLWLKSDNLVRVRELTDQLTGELVAGADITAQVCDLAGEEVGEPAQVPPVEGVPGDYLGHLPYDLELVNGQWYDVMLTIADGGYQTVYRVRARAQYKSV